MPSSEAERRLQTRKQQPWMPPNVRRASVMQAARWTERWPWGWSRDSLIFTWFQVQSPPHQLWGVRVGGGGGDVGSLRAVSKASAHSRFRAFIPEAEKGQLNRDG